MNHSELREHAKCLASERTLLEKVPTNTALAGRALLAALRVIEAAEVVKDRMTKMAEQHPELVAALAKSTAPVAIAERQMFHYLDAFRELVPKSEDSPSTSETE